ncbi:hypothetical protein V865_005460 [Kwoniella europaea PYCC6329]|uniref:Uncharacterized protein n=1 Tax=Kwoniella europaea PYCC6329 TaxID=1423913 RepID=A0AAX4KLX8_9TREE
MEGNNNDNGNHHPYDPLNPYGLVPQQQEPSADVTNMRTNRSIYQRKSHNEESYQTPAISFTSAGTGSGPGRVGDKKYHRRLNNSELIRGVHSRSKNYHYVNGKRVAGAITSTIAQDRTRSQSSTDVTQPSLVIERRAPRAGMTIIHHNIDTDTASVDTDSQEPIQTDLTQTRGNLGQQGYADTTYSQDRSVYGPRAYGNAAEDEGIDLQGLEWANRALFSDRALNTVTTGIETLGLTSSQDHGHGDNLGWMMGDTQNQDNSSQWYGLYYPAVPGPAPGPDDEICEITFSYTSTGSNAAKRVKTFSGISGKTGKEIEKAVEQWSV